MAKAKLDPELEGRQRRLGQVLGRLVQSGLTQRQIAEELAVPPQYLSDVKNGQRTMTEPFARRVAEVFRVSFPWLMTGEGLESIPQIEAEPGTSTPGMTLPVLAKPTEGDPTTSLHWDGSQVVVAGVPAAIASRARWPYVLRFDGSDYERKLSAGDLVLITEPGETPSGLMVVSHRRSLRLVRLDHGIWQPLHGQVEIPEHPKFVGSVRGIVWAPLG